MLVQGHALRLMDECREAGHQQHSKSETPGQSARAQSTQGVVGRYLRNGVRKDGVCIRFSVGDVVSILNFCISFSPLKEICTDQAVEAEFSVQVLGIRVASVVEISVSGPYR